MFHKEIKLILLSVVITTFICDKGAFATSDVESRPFHSNFHALQSPNTPNTHHDSQNLYDKAWKLRFTHREQATKYLMEAVQLNDPKALYCYSHILGGIYPKTMFSIGERDNSKALDLLKKSAKLGYEKAQRAVALIPLSGLYGLPKEPNILEAPQKAQSNLKLINSQEADETIELLSSMGLSDLKDCYGY